MGTASHRRAMLSILSIAAFFLATAQGLAVSGPCSLSLSSTPDNVVARHLAGNWTYHQQLTDHLKPEVVENGDKVASLKDIILTFSDQPDILAEIPQDHCKFLTSNDHEIFMAGTFNIFHIEFGMTSHMFVLISHHGSPAIVYWRGGEAVTNYLQMAPAIQMKNDILFMGEDDPKKPFSALYRYGSDDVCVA